MQDQKVKQTSKKIYFTEPEEVGFGKREYKKSYHRLQEAGYEIVRGDKEFSNISRSKIDTLLVRTYTCLDRQTLSSLSGVKNILRFGEGLDNIDTKYCREQKIRIYNSAGANSDAVAEYVVAVLLFYFRRLYTPLPLICCFRI